MNKLYFERFTSKLGAALGICGDAARGNMEETAVGARIGRKVESLEHRNTLPPGKRALGKMHSRKLSSNVSLTSFFNHGGAPRFHEPKQRARRATFACVPAINMTILRQRFISTRSARGKYSCQGIAPSLEERVLKCRALCCSFNSVHAKLGAGERPIGKVDLMQWHPHKSAHLPCAEYFCCSFEIQRSHSVRHLSGYLHATAPLRKMVAEQRFPAKRNGKCNGCPFKLPRPRMANEYSPRGRSEFEKVVVICFVLGGDEMPLNSMLL